MTCANNFEVLLNASLGQTWHAIIRDQLHGSIGPCQSGPGRHVPANMALLARREVWAVCVLLAAHPIRTAE